MVISEIRGKTKYQIHYNVVDEDTYETFDLYVVNDYEFGGDQSIIVKESATGNGGVSYSNGRLQEAIPLNGTLIASTRDYQGKITSEQMELKKLEVEAMSSKLMELKDAGEVVELIVPYRTSLRSNRFFIQSCKFTVDPGDEKSLSFTMNFTEARTFNIKEIKVNLVTFDTAEELKDLYNALTGNV